MDDKADVMVDKLPQRDYIPQRLELGVVIVSASSPFNKTVVIEVVPRFVVINQLQTPLVIKQKNSKNQVLIQGEQVVYNFDTKSTRLLMIRQSSKDELMGISQGKKLYQDLGSDDA